MPISLLDVHQLGEKPDEADPHKGGIG